jgi:hypothetical protein
MNDKVISKHLVTSAYYTNKGNLIAFDILGCRIHITKSILTRLNIDSNTIPKFPFYVSAGNFDYQKWKEDNDGDSEKFTRYTALMLFESFDEIYEASNQHFLLNDNSNSESAFLNFQLISSEVKWRRFKETNNVDQFNDSFRVFDRKSLEDIGITELLLQIGETERYEKEHRLMAVDFAESVLFIFEKYFPNDNRPRIALNFARQFVNGEITINELNLVRESAFSAAKYAEYTPLRTNIGKTDVWWWAAMEAALACAYACNINSENIAHSSAIYARKASDTYYYELRNRKQESPESFDKLSFTTPHTISLYGEFERQEEIYLKYCKEW